MARSKVAAPLPPSAPELSTRAAPPKWSDVPLPPPPALKPGAAAAAPLPPPPPAAAAVAPPASAAAAAALPAPPPPPAAPPPATAAPAELSWQAYPRQYPHPQFVGEAPATSDPQAAAPVAAPAVAVAPAAPVGAAAGLAAVALTPAAAEGAAASSDAGARAPAAAEGAASDASGAQKPAKVTFAADHTGAMVQVTQDLDSDKIRLDWAGKGGTIPAFEASLGMQLMYKNLSESAGDGAYMSGAGLNGGVRIALLTLEPPRYETRDTSWTAYRVGAGLEIGALGVTINLPTYRIGGVTYGGPQNASMTSSMLVLSLGAMKAFGSFDSPTEWSGFAIGAEWAPSWTKTVMTDDSGNQTESSSFNASGFAINFESGSMQSMASKMGKKAKMKIRIFFLPPVGELPLLVTASLGAVWY